MAYLYLFTLWKHDMDKPQGDDPHDYGWAGYRVTDEHVPDCFEPVPADEAPLDDIIEYLDSSRPCPYCDVLDKEFHLVERDANMTVQEWAIDKLRNQYHEDRVGYFYYLDGDDDDIDPQIF